MYNYYCYLNYNFIIELSILDIFHLSLVNSICQLSERVTDSFFNCNSKYVIDGGGR